VKFYFYKDNITVDQKDSVCEKCGSIYPVFRDATTIDSGPALECEKCDEVVLFSINKVPNHQELEKKMGVKESLKFVEHQLPGCNKCSGKLIFGSLFTSGFPRKCAHCGFANEPMSQKIHTAGISQLVKKEMTVLGCGEA